MTKISFLLLVRAASIYASTARTSLAFASHPTRTNNMITLRRALFGSKGRHSLTKVGSGSSLSRKVIVRSILGSEVDLTGESNPKEEEGAKEKAVTREWRWIWETAKERLLKMSSIASMLCVLDCTILPAATVLLPFVGAAATPDQSKWLHELGHSIALFFVLPVGSMAASMNYLSHKKVTVSGFAALGLTLIYAANGHGGLILSRLPHDLSHALQCGTWVHRATNLAGCAMLLGSNYASHRMGCAASVAGGCGHDHDHDHDHCPGCH